MSLFDEIWNIKTKYLSEKPLFLFGVDKKNIFNEGKIVIKWIIERYVVTIHKESNIKNGPNNWVTEHGNPRYILGLLLSVIMVSIKIADNISSLPKLVL